MTKRKANITPADVGNLYIDPNDEVYRLGECEVEPSAVMVNIISGIIVKRPLSGFTDLVRLKPEHPIIKPVAPRKTRSDKGMTRTGTITVIPDLISTFKIKTPALETDDDFILSIGEVHMTYATLRQGTIELLAMAGISQQDIESAPDTQGKRDLLDILAEPRKPSK